MYVPRRVIFLLRLFWVLFFYYTYFSFLPIAGRSVYLSFNFKMAAFRKLRYSNSHFNPLL